jgi:hypothetical protein
MFEIIAIVIYTCSILAGVFAIWHSLLNPYLFQQGFLEREAIISAIDQLTYEIEKSSYRATPNRRSRLTKNINKAF